MNQNAHKDKPDELDLGGAPEEINREIRDHLHSQRIDLWEKVVSERANRGIDQARSYLRTLVEQRLTNARLELDAIKKEIPV